MPQVTIDKSEVESWLVESRCETMQNIKKLDSRWWPEEQADATVWAACFFLQAAEAFELKVDVEVFCSKGKGGKNMAMVEGFYNHSHVYKQLMLDFVVGRLANPSPIMLTGESEMSSGQSVSEFAIGGGYLWDFFKLLVVPSPVRLFIARVAAKRSKQTAVERMSLLAENLIAQYQSYRESLSLGGSQFAIAIIPASVKLYSETRIIWSSEDKLICEKISEDAARGLRKGATAL